MYDNEVRLEHYDTGQINTALKFVEEEPLQFVMFDGYSCMSPRPDESREILSIKKK
jgi:hypothetical protein